MIRLTLLTLLGSLVIFGQANRRIGPLPEKGVVELSISPIDRPSSLEDLTKKSHLIVEGEVVNVLPSRQLDPERPHSIETDSLVSVRRVIKGAGPSSTIVISQMGGKVGAKEAVVKEDPLLKVGEQYLLFLVLDDRKQPNSTGFQRYLVTGVWSGRAKIRQGKVQFADQASSALRSHDNMTVETFVAAIQKIVASQAKR